MPPTASRAAAALACPGLLAAGGCGGGNGPSEHLRRLPRAPETIVLTSPAFAPGGRLPARFTCDGQGSPPPVRWSRAPARARELDLLLEDPDAPGGVFVHWVVTGISPTRRGLQNARPATLHLGRATSGRVGYEPPCPPRGASAHRYVFTLYALRTRTKLPYGATAERVRTLIARAAIARGVLTARYSRG